MGQVSSDASVSHIGFNNWLQSTYMALEQITDKKIYYRPHPLEKEPYIPEGLEVLPGELHHALSAYCVVTLNSNSGVDAVLNGTPCITMDKGAMAWDVTDHHLNAIIDPQTYDLDQWLNEMSYSQWSTDEMKNGEAWEHLRGFYGV